MFYKQIYNNDRVMITKEQFEQLIGIELIEEEGKLVCDGSLDLEGRKDITELPDNLKVLSYLLIKSSGITKLPKGLEVEYWMSISGTDIEELPEDTKLGGSLYVSNMKKPFSFPNMVKVNGHFECSHTTIKMMPEELYVKWDCYFSGSTFDNYPKVMEVGYTLYLDKTPITEIPKGLKEIYGSLDMRYTNVSKLNDNLVVYGELNLGKTLIKKLSKRLIVGDELYLYETNLKDYSNLHKVCTSFSISENRYEEIKDSLVEHNTSYWSDIVRVTFKPNYKGAYLFENEIGRYIDADNIFAKIVEQKGNVYHVQLGKDEEITYLVTDGEGRWSHGDTLEEAKDDLIYKISKRNKDDYEGLSLDSELSFEDAIVCYRVITGACSFGTRDFVENRLGDNKKDSYTIREIINLTEGEYGNDEFREFFCED